MLTYEIAEAIVKETMTRLNRNINIMNEKGIILASGDRSRINQIHEGALEVIRSGKKLRISRENKDKWRGSISGINLPIEFQNRVIGVIGITGELNEVEELGELVKMTTELMIKQSFLASQSEWKQRTKEMIIEQLIKSEPNLEIINQRLSLLELSLIPPFQISIIELKERKVQNQVLIKKIEETISEGKYLVGFLNVNRVFILISGLSEKKTKMKLQFLKEVLVQMGVEFRAGSALPVNELENIYIPYQEANLALFISEDEQQLIFYSDIETKALIYQMDDALKQRFLKRILPNGTKKTIQTLNTFFACNLNITETAKSLSVHRNTLIYRLKKIKDDTGYDPQIFKDSVPLQIAVWMYQKNDHNFHNQLI
jgi:carbohydrate diacid regulator